MFYRRSALIRPRGGSLYLLTALVLTISTSAFSPSALIAEESGAAEPSIATVDSAAASVSADEVVSVKPEGEVAVVAEPKLIELDAAILPSSGLGSGALKVEDEPFDAKAPLDVSELVAEEEQPEDGGFAISSISGWRSPDVAFNDGSGNWWFHPEYAKVSGNHYATAVLDDNDHTRYLRVRDFGFSVPSNATIRGVTVDVERKVDDTSSMSPVRDYRVRLVKGGVVGTADRSTDTDYTLVDTYESHGGPSDLWDVTLTPEDVNSAHFGVALAAKKYGSQGHWVEVLVDHIRVMVTYQLPPEAYDDAATTDEDVPVTVDVLGNDYDADGDALAVESVGAPAHGTAEINSDNDVVYTPEADFNGVDSFTYTLGDGSGATDTATVTVTVNPINDAPVALDTAVKAEEDTPVDITLTGTDVDGDSLKPQIVTPPAHGTVTITSALASELTSGSPVVTTNWLATYTPNHNFNGDDTFTFVMLDGTTESAPATVVIGVGAVNDEPHAFDRHMTVWQNVMMWDRFLGRDWDREPLTFTILDGPSHGTLTRAGHVTNTIPVLSWEWFSYLPDANYVGPDTVTYRAEDGHGGSDEATVFINVATSTWTYEIVDVTASPAAGTYADPQSVTLSVPANLYGEVPIRFTTDGTDPTCGTGTLYGGPVAVNDDVTIRAIACYMYGYESGVSSFSYVIQPPPAPEPPTGGGGGGGAPLPGGPAGGPSFPFFGGPTGQVLGVSTSEVGPAPRVLGETTSSCTTVEAEKQLLQPTDQALVNRLRGYILLQVESCGEAWYLDPVSGKRYYLPDGAAAYDILSKLGLGISRSNLARIPVGLEPRFQEVDGDGDELPNFLEEGLGTTVNLPDTDGDGVTDGQEVLRSSTNPLGSGGLSYSQSLIAKLSGRILLQAQERGQAWYLYPRDGKRYYMHAPSATKDGSGAYQIMRYLSQGISNSDLRKIPIGELPR